MSKYIPKEIMLNDLVLPDGVTILYTTWTITCNGDIVHYTAMDEENLTSKVFTDVFEVGKTYEVVMSMVRTDGPTINTKPLVITVTSGEDIYELYPMPSVIDTPVVTIDGDMNSIPTSGITFRGSNILVAGNASHDTSSWWLTNDLNQIIWREFDSQLHKTEITLEGVDLKPDRVYTMHVVYKGTNRDVSGVGSITFKPNTMMELSLDGDLSNAYYGYPIDTRLSSVDASMTLFEYELLGGGTDSLFVGSNNTGELNLNGLLLDSAYEFFILRIRATISSNVIGWKYIKFYPKEFKVESDVWNDYTYEYDNVIDVIDGKITNYDNTEFELPFKTPAGKSYQLPNNEIILLRTSNRVGRFIIDESKGVFKYVGDIYIPEITLDLDCNIFTFKIFNTGDVLIGLGSIDYTLHHMRYNPVNNNFTYITTYNIENGGNHIYSEMHMVDNVVIFMSEGENNSPQNIYGIDMVDRTIELLVSDVVTNSKNGNLIRLDENRLLVRGGISKTTNTLMNTGKIIALDIDGSTINLVLANDSRINLTPVPNSNNTAIQATLRNNRVILKQFSPFELKTSDLTTVRYVYGDIKPVDMDLSKGVVANGKKYYAPRNGSRVLMQDLETGNTSYIGPDLGLTIDKYFYGIVADNNMIYFIPVNASRVLKINPDTDTVTEVGSELGISTYKYHKPVPRNAKLYCPPVNATQVLMINIDDDSTTLIGEVIPTLARNYYSSVLHPNGKIYCIPVNSTKVLMIDTNPTTPTATLISIDLGAVTGKYYKGYIADNGMIYCPPLNASRVLQIDTTNDVVSLIGNDLGADGGKYVNGLIVDGDKLYCAPLNTNRVLKVNTLDSTANHIGIDLNSYYELGSLFESGEVYSKYFIGLKANNNKLYFAPVYISKVLEVNPNDDTTALVGSTVGGFNMYVSGVESVTGKLYFSPYNGTNCLEVDPAGLDELIHTMNILSEDKNSIDLSKPFTYTSNGGEKFNYSIFLNNGNRVFLSHSKDRPKMLIYR